MKGTRGKRRRGKTVVLNVAISETVMKAFREHIGPDRVLCRAVEQALAQEVARGKNQVAA